MNNIKEYFYLLLTILIGFAVALGFKFIINIIERF